MLKIEWRGTPVLVVHRTPDMIARIDASEAMLADPESKASRQPEYARNPARATA